MPEGKSEWRDMSSAPKDGTSIMTYPHYRVTHWEDTDKVFGDEAAFVEKWDQVFEAWWPLIPQPTHWIPLVSPPSSTEENLQHD